MAQRTIVFIHGLWIHPSAWQPWMDFFKKHGYDSINPSWPGDGPTVEASRANPGAIANHGVEEVVQSISKVIATLPQPPIVIGHSFGGLIAQIILSRGLAAAGVAIDPAPIKGVWQLPFSALKSSLPVLGNPFNVTKAVLLNFSQFRHAFCNAIPEEEAKQIYDQWVIPAPARPLFQAAMATIAGSETKVDTSNTKRGPLLITGGSKDNIAPPIFGKASAGKYNKSVITEFKLFENRGHSLASDHGWTELAEYSFQWLKEKGF